MTFEIGGKTIVISNNIEKSIGTATKPVMLRHMFVPAVTPDLPVMSGVEVILDPVIF